MKIIIAPDSFKASISSLKICQVLKSSLLKVIPEAEILTIPVSDGGEGFLEALSAALKLDIVTLNLSDPRGKIIKSEYGIHENTAYLEMARAAGLQLLEDHEKNPLNTTTYGLGEMVLDAINRGINKFVMGIGGSATNDGGAGMAQALGFQFIDRYGKTITAKMTGKLLGKVASIKAPILPLVNLKVACDVWNPLLGEKGTVYTYAKQKGAEEDDLPILENNLRHLNQLFHHDLCRKIENIPGTGAAGGLGGGLMAFLDAQLVSGSNLVMDTINFDEKIKNADIIITGEGQYDSQTSQGKIVSEILNRAEKNNVPVYGIFGRMEGPGNEIFNKSVQLVDFATSEETLKYPVKYLKRAVNQLFKDFTH
ncbi:MAG: glycerate kinase [Candidatus Marinimicrobia bacterium]|nr:glycerate kinase [Candidatus Neomarinimicrobiota bacterium]